jgi:hypothetical protein
MVEQGQKNANDAMVATNTIQQLQYQNQVLQAQQEQNKPITKDRPKPNWNKLRQNWNKPKEYGNGERNGQNRGQGKGRNPDWNRNSN